MVRMVLYGITDPNIPTYSSESGEHEFGPEEARAPRPKRTKACAYGSRTPPTERMPCHKSERYAPLGPPPRRKRGPHGEGRTHTQRACPRTQCSTLLGMSRGSTARSSMRAESRSIAEQPNRCSNRKCGAATTVARTALVSMDQKTKAKLERRPTATLHLNSSP